MKTNKKTFPLFVVLMIFTINAYAIQQNEFEKYVGARTRHYGAAKLDAKRSEGERARKDRLLKLEQLKQSITQDIAAKAEGVDYWTCKLDNGLLSNGTGESNGEYVCDVSNHAKSFLILKLNLFPEKYKGDRSLDLYRGDTIRIEKAKIKLDRVEEVYENQLVAYISIEANQVIVVNDGNKKIDVAERIRKDAMQVTSATRTVDPSISMIVAKINRYVNPQVCGTGIQALEFEVSLMPTGEVAGTPRLKSSSGIPACDQAVERAILQAQPLPVPRDPDLFAQFRNFILSFRPHNSIRGSGSTSIEEITSDYMHTLSEEMSRKAIYPRIAQMRGWQGTVIMEILVSGNGEPEFNGILQSSGYEVLDKQAVENWKKSAPHSSSPNELYGQKLKLPYSFSLK